MKTYEVYWGTCKTTVIADPLVFKKDFFRETDKENLVFTNGEMVVAIFRNWDCVVDVSGKYIEKRS